MPRKATSILINPVVDEATKGIAIEKLVIGDKQTADSALLAGLEQASQAHREERHSFFLLETGTVQVEIDFQTYTIRAPSVIYLHPDQVHRILAFEQVTVGSIAITNENLNPHYLTLLEGIVPAKPLDLAENLFAIISEAMSLCLTLSVRKDDKLYHSQLRDGCHVIIALILSHYLASAKPTDRLSRYDRITKDFKELLERTYTTTKRPTDYAKQLHISTPYLNECLKKATGYSVSYHIQQRIILEAKRLLYHSAKSVKEIAAELGYDDYPYFSRLFVKSTGLTALAFRNKNRD